MLSFAASKKIAAAGFKKPKRLLPGQHWYTPEGKLGTVMKGDDYGEFVLLIIETSTVSQHRITELIYVPKADEILRAIAKAGKHRLLGMQPGARHFEVNGVNLHQYGKGRKAEIALAKEFVAIQKQVQ